MHLSPNDPIHAVLGPRVPVCAEHTWRYNLNAMPVRYCTVCGMTDWGAFCGAMDCEAHGIPVDRSYLNITQ